jgi:hypothetical protein
VHQNQIFIDEYTHCLNVMASNGDNFGAAECLDPIIVARMCAAGGLDNVSKMMGSERSKPVVNFFVVR